MDTPIGISDSLVFAPLPFDKAISENISQNHPMLKNAWLAAASLPGYIELNKLDSKPSFGVGLDYIMVNERTDAEPAHNGRTSCSCGERSKSL
ncbi:MAG: hypothetical protein R2825_15665 [Saprospiraceae bacterium]